MQNLKQIIDEIKDLKKDATHKSALRIFNLLGNNKKLFIKIIDQHNFEFILKDFEKIAYKNPTAISDARGLEEFNKLCENLLFHCNRLV